jgi:CDP-4-dehydro-6-deoxyglucose reductase
MPFTVTVQPSGKTFSVERDEPILMAAIRQGVGLPYGCRDGACGSCKCRMLEGRVIHGVHQQKALSHEEELAGLVLTCQAAPQTDIVLEARTVPGAGEFAIRKLPSRVVSIDKPAADVAIVRLQLPANDLFQYRAGQYIEFILRDGSRRSYSMANAPHTVIDKPQLELHIRHLPGGKFTDHVFGAMKEKEILRVEGPFGSFFLREDSEKPIILLASGTGFAPIKAQIEHLFHHGDDRPMVLYWGARARRDLYLPDLPAAWARDHPNFNYIPVLSDATPEDAWTGRTGFVHHAVLDDFADLSGYQVYSCGAPAMTDLAKETFVARGLPEDEFYCDAFTPSVDPKK